MPGELSVSLNAHEVGVLLSALQLLSTGEEYDIARHYGSAPALYDRLNEVFQQLDQEQLELKYEPYIEPSFWLNNSVVYTIINMKAAIAVLKPVLLAFLTSAAVTQLVVDLLAAYAGSTDNTIDDGIVRIVRQALGLEETAAEW